MLKLLLIGILTITLLAGGAFLFADLFQAIFPMPQAINDQTPTVSAPTLTPTPLPTPVIIQPDNFKELPNIPFVYQTFNNCGPAALSMYLAYYGINQSQQQLADILRPYNNPQGYQDDKNVSLEEFEPIAKKHNLIYFYQPNGSVQKIKLFLANDIPILTRTWLFPDDYIGHFRIISGFNESTEEFIQVDSIEGSRRYSYQQFLKLWQPFNYEYALLAPPDKEAIVKTILGQEVSPQVAWTNAKQRAQQELSTNPTSLYSQFNLATSLYRLGQYQESVQTFEKLQPKLPIKMLWYQIEPIKAYFELKMYNQVFNLTDQIFRSGNPADSESYILRGDTYQAQGKLQEAKTQYQKAYLYNGNLPLAKERLGI